LRAARRASFEEFVRAEAQNLLRSARLLAGSRPEAEDLLQEALVRTFRRWGRSSIDHPVAYVRTVMAHLAYDGGRRRRFRTVTITPEHESAVPDDTESVHQREALRQALASLPPRQRVVMVLRFLEDRTERETAQTLGCTVGTVKRHSSRALARLRDMPVARQWHPAAAGTPVR
jgi:RNA polymerase sigma-70 factor (sigma-E family)